VANAQDIGQQPDKAAGGLELAGKRSLIIVYIFLVSLLLPFKLTIGPVLIFPYRIVSIVIFFYVFYRWIFYNISGSRIPDLLVILHAVWVIFALMIVHGFSQAIETSGVYFIEFVTPYLIARILITNADEFHRAYKFLYMIILFLLPFAIYESFTGHYLLLDLLNKIYSSHEIAVWQPRFGLVRAIGVFEHPILYGVFCVFAFSMAFYAMGNAKSLIMAGLRTLPVFMATFFALSAGPLLGLVTQMGLIAWDLGTRWLPNRWILLIGAIVGSYVFVDILSNRSPIEVLISHVAFQDNSAYNRVLIWVFGTAEVARHPFFGIGLNDWIRPKWMFPSVDNFWLITAMRYGLPALIFLASAIGILLWKLSWRNFRSVRLSNYRKAWVFTLSGLIVAASTVHLWNQVFCLFAFFLGSGVWMLSANDETETDEA